MEDPKVNPEAEGVNTTENTPTTEGTEGSTETVTTTVNGEGQPEGGDVEEA